MGPGPPLFEASVPYREGSDVLFTQSPPLRAPSGTFRSFRHRFRPSLDLTQPGQGASSSFAIDQSLAPVPLHTSDGVVPGGVVPITMNPLTAEATAAPAPARSFFRSPFADWNPMTGIANDSNRASVEMARSRSGTRRMRSTSGTLEEKSH